MNIIDGKGIVLGRLASFVAKQALKGEEIFIVNCDEVIISGKQKNIEEEFKEKRSRVGSSQKGPKHHRNSEKIVKRTIRGMLPDHRKGRGRIAFKNIKCYNKTPKELQDLKKINLNQKELIKFITVKEIAKK